MPGLPPNVYDYASIFSVSCQSRSTTRQTKRLYCICPLITFMEEITQRHLWHESPKKITEC